MNNTFEDWYGLLKWSHRSYFEMCVCEYDGLCGHPKPVLTGQPQQVSGDRKWLFLSGWCQWHRSLSIQSPVD